ncbi:MAG: ABC transporter permease [Methanobrevibacter sp.]|nr:ABC transporter permease [Methanobrevibacter sp.]
MLTFIKMEFLKLKRSKIFLLSILMAALPSVLMFIATFAFDETQSFDALFSTVNMYMSALFAILLLAILSTEIWVIAFVKYIVYFLIFKAEVFQHAT